MKNKRSKHNGLEQLQQRYSYMFVAPFAVGLLMFFAIPMLKSVIYAFSDVKIEPGRVATDFVGLSNFKYLIFEDAEFMNQLVASLSLMFYSLPLIIAFSLVVAMMLNRHFFGRTLMRALFFLPIVITASAVLPILGEGIVALPLFEGEGGIDEQTIIANLNIPPVFSSIVTFLINSVTDIIYKSAVQIILFLGGLQNIPSSQYEVSTIEGANKWEEFWFITLPGLRHVITLVSMYTMIDLFVGTDNTLVDTAYNRIQQQQYGTSSALLWFYFVIVIAVIAAVYLLYRKFCLKRWD